MLDNLDSSYENIGGKIKGLAKWTFIVGACCVIFAGISLLFRLGFEDGWWALFIIFFGPIIPWVSSWSLYAFGQLVEDTHKIRTQINDIKGTTETSTSSEKDNCEKEHAQTTQKSFDFSYTPHQKENTDFVSVKNNTVVCSFCKSEQPKARKICSQCGTKLDKCDNEQEIKKKNENKIEHIYPKQEKTLVKNLEYALLFQTDDGMLRYLKNIQDESVQNILKSPKHLIRKQIQDLLNNI